MWLRIVHFLGLTNLTNKQVQLYEKLSEEKEVGFVQLTFLILFAVIIGVSITLGINTFGENSAQANQEAVTHDVLTIASRAQAWYRKPLQMGGGGHSYNGLTFSHLHFDSLNDNGRYAIITNNQILTITGMAVSAGNELVVTATVDPDTILLTTIQQ